MNDLDLKKLQQRLLKIFEVFHEVCEKNDLTYYMVGGTMLGAIRHKGFIPWDDDIDVAMPREDYEKLLRLPKNKWPKNIRMDTPVKTQNWIIPFSKLIDKNTSLTEMGIERKRLSGVFLDIFPLDGASNNVLSSKLLYYNFALKRRLIVYKLKDQKQLNLVERIIKKLLRKKSLEVLHNNMVESMKIKTIKESKIIANFAGAWGLNEFMDKRIVGKAKLYKFEGKEFYGVRNSHDYLESLYGDYMKLPAKDKQKSHHDLSNLKI